MRGDLTIRQTKTSSGATAVQVVRNRGKKREVLHHVGSAHTADELSAMLKTAEIWAEQHRDSAFPMSGWLVSLTALPVTS